MNETDTAQPPETTNGRTRTFTASRLTKGNALFPTRITVTPVMVIRSKRSWVTKEESSLTIKQVSSVRILTGILFSDIWIESTGGSSQISSHGHFKGDAREIKRLIEEYQRA